MKKLIASLLTIALLTSFAAVSLADIALSQEYETFRFENYLYQVPRGWMHEEEIRTDEDHFTYLTRAHFAKEKESLSGGALVAIIDYPDYDKVDLENNEPVLEEWAAEMAKADGMDLRREEKLRIDNVYGLLFTGYLGDTPVSFTAWEDLGFLYGLVYANPEYRLEQVIEFTKSLLSRVRFDYQYMDNIGYEVVKEYLWDSSLGQHNDLVIRNTVGYDAVIYLDVQFYDWDGNLVDRKEDGKRACQDGYETFWMVCSEKPYSHIEYNLEFVPDTQDQGLQSILELSKGIRGNTAIITAKNTGDKPIDLLEYYLLFLDEDGDVVACEYDFWGDEDGELKPGITMTKEIECPMDFVSLELYATSM